ncbi:cGMP-dependent 3',5'-cyclic phosphodiesterase [Geodia barretti]|uniref:cGMP-dependent 3',5'-cyclic phosphodiesterase n=1 Tax=Geodia barretti TaxID=519541 RepID=A0AA35SG12_GEOBA|nr:cGMP-dependent 3',5'-cyclic phosphodiesterase [Geodia barretti]
MRVCVGTFVQEYKQVLDLMQSNILDTDIAAHLRKMNDIQQMGKDGYDATNSDHHKLMCSLLMTSCDISNTCKEWDTAKSIARVFFHSRRFGEGARRNTE